jgi:hypothetical protein
MIGGTTIHFYQGEGTMGNWVKLLVMSFLVIFMVTGCGPGRDETAQETVSEQPEHTEEPVSAADVTAEKAEEKPTESAYQRTKAMDWSITPERRAAIEEAIPDAKGFIDGTELVQKIIDENIRGREARAQVFADAAAGQYIFFAAQTNPNPFNNNASLNLIFGEGAFGPDFMQVQLTEPENYSHQDYLDTFGGTGYVTAFVGKLSVEENRLKLDPAHDVYLPGYVK